MEAQCWICPYCHDDHSRNVHCKPKDLKDRIDKLSYQNHNLRNDLTVAQLNTDMKVTPEKLKEHLDKNYSSETFKRQVVRIFEELKI